MSTERSTFGFNSILPTNYRSRAEAFAKCLQDKLRSLSGLDDNQNDRSGPIEDLTVTPHGSLSKYSEEEIADSVFLQGPLAYKRKSIPERSGPPPPLTNGRYIGSVADRRGFSSDSEESDHDDIVPTVENAVHRRITQLQAQGGALRRLTSVNSVDSNTSWCSCEEPEDDDEEVIDSFASQIKGSPPIHNPRMRNYKKKSREDGNKLLREDAPASAPAENDLFFDFDVECFSPAILEEETEEANGFENAQLEFLTDKVRCMMNGNDRDDISDTGQLISCTPTPSPEKENFMFNSLLTTNLPDHQQLNNIIANDTTIAIGNLCDIEGITKENDEIKNSIEEKEDNESIMSDTYKGTKPLQSSVEITCKDVTNEKAREQVPGELEKHETETNEKQVPCDINLCLQSFKDFKVGSSDMQFNGSFDDFSCNNNNNFEGSTELIDCNIQNDIEKSEDCLKPGSSDRSQNLEISTNIKNLEMNIDSDTLETESELQFSVDNNIEVDEDVVRELNLNEAENATISIANEMIVEHNNTDFLSNDIVNIKNGGQDAIHAKNEVEEMKDVKENTQVEACMKAEEIVDCGVDRGECSIVVTKCEDNDVDEPINPRMKLRRCSSLKTWKTPPGTPGRKKIVRFADALGLDLADIRTFLDEIPKIPISAFDDLNVDSQPVPAQVPPVERTLLPMFQQPGTQMDFLQKVKQNNVSLESAILTDVTTLAISGIIRVRNISFHKSVHVRYTKDSWATFSDMQATYVPGSSDGFCDNFSFTLYGHTMEIGDRLEFAIRYESGSTQLWDNNGGINYVFQCMPRSPAPLFPPLGSSPVDTWNKFY